MGFTSKYTIAPLPKTTRVPRAPKLAPEQRARKRLADALKVQIDFVAAERAGREFTVTRNGKSIKPRAFWLTTANGIAFTPRYGNDFLFENGQGVLVADLAALSSVMADFAAAVESGEFDARMVEIASARVGKGAGARRRGRPRKEA